MSNFKKVAFNSSTTLKVLASVFLAVTLSACSDSDDPIVAVPMPEPTPMPMEYSYQVTMVNLTHSQPLSPLAVLLHGDDTMWSIGTPVSNALEILAEGGDNSDFLASDGVISASSADSVLMPGNSVTMTMTTTDEMATHLTLASMLVNTNDAFVGLTGLELSTLALNTSKSWNLSVYDAGSEFNSELPGTIPGPADGGTGYDVIRDDVNDQLTRHQGIVGHDDGLTASVLSQAHKFDNPAIRLTVQRTQ